MPSIEEAIRLKHEQHHRAAFDFRVELPDLTRSGMRDATGVALQNTNTQANSVLNSSLQANQVAHRVTAFNPSTKSVSVKKNSLKGMPWFSAESAEMQTITMKIHEMEDGLTGEYLHQWPDLIINPDGTYNPPATYKRDITFFELDANQGDVVVTTYMGCFISEVTSPSYAYESDSVAEYTVTIYTDGIRNRTKMSVSQYTEQDLGGGNFASPIDGAIIS